MSTLSVVRLPPQDFAVARVIRLLIAMTLGGVAEAATPPGEKLIPSDPPREQIGEVLGRPVYRDQVRDDNLEELFFAPVRKDYAQSHADELKPTEEEVVYAVQYYTRQLRKELDERGGETAVRERLEAAQKKLESGGLARTEAVAENRNVAMLSDQLDIERKAGLMAWWSLATWKAQSHVYNAFGGGRVLISEAGPEAYDAGRKQMEFLEQFGKIRIDDPELRKRLFSRWARDHGTRLKSAETGQRLLLYPPYVKSK